MDLKDFYTWATIAVVVLTSTAGDVLSAQAMQKIGDFSELRRSAGVGAVLVAVSRSGRFLLAIVFMAASFFTLMVALSWADVSLVAPAAASLTFVTNAIAAQFFLNENVDQRRWIAALLVFAGVALLAR